MYEENPLDGKFLDFEAAKVQAITLDQLERTHKENDILGQPLRGIYHYALIHQIVNMCKEQMFDVEIYDMFAAQNRDKQTPGVVLLPQVEAHYGQKAVEAHILRRVYANIRIKNFDDGEFTTNLAVAFHQRGIQVGFGNNVMICHNQCMLGQGQFISTYAAPGEKRMEEVTIPMVLDTIKSWLIDARHIIVNERDKIERMKQIDVPAEQMFLIIGMLNAIRVKCDSSYKEIHENRVYPLNQAQITRFTENLLLHHHRHGHVTAWDLYNTATDLYKANAMDVPSILPQNLAMSRFLQEQFAL